jgi:hypothetical protein
MNLTVKDCVVSSLLIILFLFVILIIVAYWLIKNYEASYNANLNLVCKDLSYYPYPAYDFQVVKGVYNSHMSKYLVTMALNATLSHCTSLGKISTPLIFNKVIPIQGSDPFSSNIQRTFCYVCISDVDKIICLCYPGTVFIDEWMSDLDYSLTEATSLNNYVNGVQVHNGFYSIYNNIRDQIWSLYNSNKSYQLIITGISLGGAVSTLSAFDFMKESPIVYTFAAPRSGNIQYAQLLNKNTEIYRVVNTEDIVPDVPPAVIENYLYEHTNNVIPFTVNLGSIVDNHLKAYLENV